ncbi:transmembrane protease serine 2 [Oreochromis niloticus]|uniref:transmembrane protease serine 2 n=1 Tax=Oreochromis niloticus TaxID=8128 RepID=UPI000904A7A8|nr:transmembrane protease serine 2 [Oreochromis niloticus]
MVKQKMTTNPYLDTCPHFIREYEKMKLPALAESDDQPQYVHNVALKPPPEISPSIPKHKDFKHRCIKFTVAAVISLLLLLLLAGVLLAYYFSSSCIHGIKCGDGNCVWESQWCDGVTDCPAGQDEANCVSLHGSSFLLQIYSTQSKAWRSVCSHGWTEEKGRASCQSIGYSRGTYFKSGQQRADCNDGFLLVKSKFNPQASILQQLALQNTCPNNMVVTLHCTDCGSRVNSSRASAGQLASLGSWPWQVSLQVAGSHRCGGAIISPYWIVTAAQCVTWATSPGDWAVYAGIVDPLGPLFNPAYSVHRIITHEAYNSQTLKNDIALMRLSQPLDITGSRNIGPVCLPNVGLKVTAHQKCWITRFGHRANDSGLPYLMEAQVSLIDAPECNSFIAYTNRISQDMICARDMQAGGGVCHADGGGPLVSLMDGVWWLIGDSIWGEHCAGQDAPGVYGNVAYFLDWIHRQMKRYQDD